MNSKINIAIDGFSACGKSTLAKDIANILGYTFIDSGAMYRAVTLYCLQQQLIGEGVQVNNDAIIAALPNIEIEFQYQPQLQKSHVLLQGVDVENEIRKPEIATFVSEISTIPEVRKKLVALQQKIGESKGVVMDGRDIGTVVFPNAELKLFVTASEEERTKRRFKELKAKGIPSTMEEVAENLKKRDHIDSTRATDPLRQADDAIIIDNTCLSKEEQVTLVLNKVKALMVKA